MAEIKRDLEDILKILQERIKVDFVYTEIAIDKDKKIEEDFDQIAFLLVNLYLDLNFSPFIKDKYIPQMKDGNAKNIALTAFKIAKEIAKGPSMS